MWNELQETLQALSLQQSCHNLLPAFWLGAYFDKQECVWAVLLV